MTVGRGLRILALVSGLTICVNAGEAQEFPVFQNKLPVASLSSERLFSESLAGSAFLQQSRQKAVELTTENRRIEAELEAEELDLTERRKTLPAPEFRLLAESFDKKVVETRRVQNAKAQALSQELDAARRAFSQQARPVLEQMMLDLGIVFILNDQAILLASRTGDITDEALRRVNEEIGSTLLIDK